MERRFIFRAVPLEVKRTGQVKFLLRVILRRTGENPLSRKQRQRNCLVLIRKITLEQEIITQSAFMVHVLNRVPIICLITLLMPPRKQISNFMDQRLISIKTHPNLKSKR